MNYTTLIVGYGVVGHNLAAELAPIKPDIYDAFKPQYNTKKPIRYNFCFICVDTPQMDEVDAPLDDIVKVINQHDADIYIIKSTIPPGSTEYLCELTGKTIIFSPEYYGGTQHCNNFDFNFTILGGNKAACQCVVQLLQYVYDARHTFHITTPRTAELTKYMENSFLATKVAFCCQFFELAEKFGVSYEELRELFILDPRVNPSHTFVYADHPYYTSHCLDKDVPTIVYYGEETASFLADVIKYNNKQKKTYSK